MSKAAHILSFLCISFTAGAAIDDKVAVSPKAPPTPCVDSHSLCSYWESIGECDKKTNSMPYICTRSCGFCNKLKNTTRIIEPGPCVDGHRKCTYWESIGECQKNQRYMLSHCMRSCGLCNNVKETSTAECQDSNHQCKGWASIGECKANPQYMLRACQVSCKVCKPESGQDNTCKDKNRNCDYWAKNGECTSIYYHHFMTLICPASCKKC